MSASNERRVRIAAQLGFLVARVCTPPGTTDPYPGVPALSDDGVDVLEAIVAELVEQFGPPRRRP